MQHTRNIARDNATHFDTGAATEWALPTCVCPEYSFADFIRHSTSLGKQTMTPPSFLGPGCQTKLTRGPLKQSAQAGIALPDIFGIVSKRQSTFRQEPSSRRSSRLAPLLLVRGPAGVSSRAPPQRCPPHRPASHRRRSHPPAHRCRRLQCLQQRI